MTHEEISPRTYRVDVDGAEPLTVVVRESADELPALIAEALALRAAIAVPQITTLKTARIVAAWAEQDRRLSDYIVQVPISGTPRPFGCDPVSRENIIGINALISQEMAGLLPAGTVANPRGFTPKGQSGPVEVTHAEFALIGAYMAGAKDAHFIAYATHKAAINALTTAEAVAAYDITAGWPV